MDETSAETSVSDEAVTAISASGLELRNLIYTVRGMQVMLDSDLATLYGVETKVLNQAVSRNAARFPERFCFRLTRDETKNLWSQCVKSCADLH